MLVSGGVTDTPLIQLTAEIYPRKEKAKQQFLGSIPCQFSGMYR